MSLHEIHDNGGRPWTVAINTAANGKSHVLVRSGQKIVIDIEADQVWPGPATLIRVAGRDRFIRVGPNIFAFELDEGDSVLEYSPEIGNSDVVYDYAVTKQWIYLLAEGYRMKPTDGDPYGVFYGHVENHAPLVKEPLDMETIRERPGWEHYAIDEAPLMTPEACAALMARPPHAVSANELCMQMRKVLSIAPPLMTKTLEIISHLDFRNMLIGDATVPVPEFCWTILCDRKRTYYDAPDTPVRPDWIGSYGLAEIIDSVEPDYRPFFEWIMEHEHEFRIIREQKRRAR